jgi:hypothetical protein
MEKLIIHVSWHIYGMRAAFSLLFTIVQMMQNKSLSCPELNVQRRIFAVAHTAMHFGSVYLN